ncbi:MAG: 4-hydroxythreonine-4-phosphate dehydrogenase PdxA [Hyphomicrobiaceae bacterium]
MGDPSGISPELTARILCDAEARALANYIVIGDARVLSLGAAHAGVTIDLPVWRPGEARLPPSDGAILVDLETFDAQNATQGVATPAGGRFALTNFRAALRLAALGGADACTFTPFNKHAMRLFHAPYVDEIAIIDEATDGAGQGREFNILAELWNARVTSHIPLSQVAERITRRAVLDALQLTDRSMRAAGFAAPRIAVAALNPHAGDGGNFGHEDDEEIAPAVEDAQSAGIICDGPFPSDTVFLRARRGDYDAVQTMYHDQGQIAMKLMGFERGVTLIGGYPFPVCTPAHGTAYDIAGQGRADLGATREAMRIAARLATVRSPATSSARTRVGALEAACMWALALGRPNRDEAVP